MRLLFWSDLFWPYVGGAEIFGSKLAASLHQRGYEITVATSHGQLDLTDKADYRGIPNQRMRFRAALSRGSIDMLMEARRQAAQLKQAVQPELIFVNGIQPSVLFHLQTSAQPAPTLLRVNQHLFSDKDDLLETLAGRVLRASDWVCCVSSHLHQLVTRDLPELTSRSSIVFNGVELPDAEPTPLPFEPAEILCLGRLVPQKGFGLALEAMQQIGNRFPNVRMTVAGDGPLREALQQRATELGLKQRVQFVGPAAPERVASLVNQATVVLMPSRWEGFPTVALQAASMARPIVASNVGGLPDAVAASETGILVPPDDSAALADALAEVLSDRDRATRMGQAGRQRIQEAFRWEHCVDAYDAICQQLTALSEAETTTPPI